ncbi:hypothetical protein [Bosea sp. (in: a-proteobacteria)]|uniref:hypothetical protein n=1 Tax=Bosea sp. (in: a-proteobacteria) TaxID=1871050 RepID=UPI00273463EC|nr:hypothetical protein [Bosea sp. (in: a-proteobacteria)]MDP3409192.1 hypothetical protein [Bosea sp. (in: a-proteobacteria)]
METILSSVGQIAGIAGISVVTFLFVCKAMLQNVDWPTPTKRETSKTLNRMLLFAFSLAIAGMITWLGAKAISATHDVASETINKGGTVDYQFRIGTSSNSAFKAGGNTEISALSEIQLIDWYSTVRDKLIYGDYLTEKELIREYLYKKSKWTPESESALKSRLINYSVSNKNKLYFKNTDGSKYQIKISSNHNCDESYYSFVQISPAVSQNYAKYNEQRDIKDILIRNDTSGQEITSRLGSNNKLIEQWNNTFYNRDGDFDEIIKIKNTDSIGFKVRIQKRLNDNDYQIGLIMPKIPTCIALATSIQ